MIFICSNVEVSYSDRIMGAWSAVWDALLEGRNEENTDGDDINRKDTYISDMKTSKPKMKLSSPSFFFFF